jgi:hypothetical protein
METLDNDTSVNEKALDVFTINGVKHFEGYPNQVG